MPPPPKITILLPLYNTQEFISAAIRSLLAQTFADFELLIINDGSTDRSRDIASSFTDPRIRIIDQQNRGLIETLNRGLHLAAAPYIARMDADDLATPTRLAQQFEFLEAHPNVSLLGGFITTIDEQGHTLAPVVPFPQQHEEIWKSLGRRPWVMCHPAVMYRREAAIAAGGYNSNFAHAEDVEFYARMMTQHRAANLAHVLLQYRLRRSAVSGTQSERGRINALRVAAMIDRWQPGHPLQSPGLSDSPPTTDNPPPTPAQIESRYQCRVARELLRARQWRRAARHYLTALRHRPLDWLPYAGLAAAALHKGAAGSIPGSSLALRLQDATLKQRTTN